MMGITLGDQEYKVDGLPDLHLLMHTRAGPACTASFQQVIPLCSLKLPEMLYKRASERLQKLVACNLYA